MAMKNVTANIQGKEYTLACDAGQENHLYQLVQQLNGRAASLTKGVGKLSEQMMLLYTALMFADELHEATKENARLKDELAHALALVNEHGDEARLAALEEGMAESLHALAHRIEGIAEKLSA
jgi:cell division protein ZapA